MDGSKKTAQKQEEAEAIGNSCNDVSSERFLHRLRRCYVKIPKPRYTVFHPHSARRMSSRKPLLQPRQEQEMIMEMKTLLSIPDSEKENETESSNSKSTFSFDVGGNAEADDHKKEGSSSPKKEESTFLAPIYTWTDLKKTLRSRRRLRP